MEDKELRFAVCDDRPKERERLEIFITDYCSEKAIKAHVDLFDSGESLISSMRSNPYSVVFLDIFMDNMTGIEAAREIRTFSNCPIVFVTTSPDYALEGFELNALHYLVKPCTKEAMANALERCVDVVKAQKKSINVKTGREQISIRQIDIQYMEVFGNRTLIHTSIGEISTYAPLGEFFNQLDKELFIHPQRSYIVSLAYINEIPSATITLKNGVVISISRQERTSVKQKYLNYLMELSKTGVV